MHGIDDERVPPGAGLILEERIDVAVPKRKMSRSNTRTRRSQWKASRPNLTTCQRCRQPKLSHVACENCQTYNNRRVEF